MQPIKCFTRDEVGNSPSGFKEGVLQELTIARIYVLEGERKDHHAIVDEIFSRLHDEHKVKWVTQFRAVSGFGVHGKINNANDLIYLNGHLPAIIEFFDTDQVVRESLA